MLSARLFPISNALVLLHGLSKNPPAKNTLIWMTFRTEVTLTKWILLTRLVT